MNSSIPVLIVAYRRKECLQEILRLCEDNGINKIYVAIDGPKNNSLDGKRDHFEMNMIVSKFMGQFSGEIFLLNRSMNVGCAASVLSACDWIFSKESAAMILEDDCIPTSDFFKFSQLTIDIMNRDKRIWLSCGTQFMPADNQMDSWFLSKYPLTWGWSTTRAKWLEISAELRVIKPIKNTHISKTETIYWNAGARRAQSGWVDVWDTVLAQKLLSLDKLVIQPKNCLISNHGNDIFATNTVDPSKWVATKIGDFRIPKNFPIPEPKVDLWLRREFFKISKRHWLTTKYTWTKDFLIHYRKPYRPLVKRWSLAK